MNKSLTLFLVLSFLLSSCTLVNKSTESSSGSDTSKDSETTEEYTETETDKESETDTEETEPGSETNTGNSTEEEQELQIEVYASNDIHGHVLEDNNSMGMRKYGTFMKKVNQEPNTLTIDQGDTWQGSIYSNYNHGTLINDIMSEARISARTIGNHDFDWGTSYIAINKDRIYNGYQVPTLGANIYDYDFEHKVEGTEFADDLGQKTVTYTLDNGLKVGIVGTIGKDQITSISSMYTTNICFKDHIAVIKAEATRLRNEEHCDVVIASCHADQDDLRGNSLSSYVDLVLCGHSHRAETSKEGSLLYAQFGCNNQYIGHITLTYNTNAKDVTNTTYVTLNDSDVTKVINNKIDPTINQLVDNAINECDEEANVVLANNVTGYFDKKEKSVNVMCNAIMDTIEANNLYDDVAFSYCNDARAYLPYNQWTYANLYDSFPFDNLVYIIEVTGEEIQNEVMNYNRVCRASWFNGNISLSGKYKIACIDYLAFHTNSNRYYDYFPTNNGSYIAYLPTNYRLLLRSWLIDNGYNTGKLMDASDFDSSLAKFSTEFNII